MNQFVFILGREQKIARLEVESVLRRFCFDFHPVSTSLPSNIFIINTCGVEDIPISSLMNLLGGTVKIFKIVAEAKYDLSKAIIDKLSELKKGSVSKFNYGISDFSSSMSGVQIKALGLKAKKVLKQFGSVRFVEPKEGSEVSPVAALSNQLDSKGAELGIFKEKDYFLLGRLIAVTDPNGWSERDYGKPRSDKYSGMTPPKLARMLINITLGDVDNPNIKYQISNQCINPNVKKNLKLEIGNLTLRPTVVDPFCGSGNILMEAMMLGYEIIGSDASEKAVSDTKENLRWLSQQISNDKYQMTNKYQKSNVKINNLTIQQFDNVFVADATSDDFSKKLKSHDLNSCVVVTEPYLGEPKKFKSSLKATIGEYAKVKELYLGFLKNISGLDALAITLIFPLVETGEGKIYSLYNDTLDEIRKMGYTPNRVPVNYGRDYQVVKREVVFLRKR